MFFHSMCAAYDMLSDGDDDIRCNICSVQRYQTTYIPDQTKWLSGDVNHSLFR
jgi:hypothetical protein